MQITTKYRVSYSCKRCGFIYKNLSFKGCCPKCGITDDSNGHARISEVSRIIFTWNWKSFWKITRKDEDEKNWYFDGM